MSRAAWRVVLAAAVLAVVAPALTRTIDAPGHRGAAAVTSGFRAGRWDARFLVARGPAALVLPHEPSTVTLTVTGPANVTAALEDGTRSRRVGGETETWTLALPRGGRVALDVEGTLRLHHLRLERTSRAPSLGMAGAWARVTWRRHRAVVVALAVIAAIVVTAGVGGRTRVVSMPASPVPPLAAGVVFLSCAAQVLLLTQPQIIGDPGAYHDMGGRFRDALREPWRAGDALHELRPYAGLSATALVYGALRLVHDEPRTTYVAHAAALAAAVFFLVRAAMRVGGRRLGIVTAVLAGTYATFPVICGIVQPEPFILLLWCFAFDRIVAVTNGDAARRAVPAGLAFGLGLALHPQGLWYLLVAAFLCLVPFALLLYRPVPRRVLLAFGAGLLPVALGTAVGEAYARPAVHVLEERYGFFAYTAPHPLGFWLFLDTDGWQGPVRLDETRYARQFAEAKAQGAIATGLDAWTFTLRFVAGEAEASLRAVLRNLERLFRRPDNPFHRTWILPYGVQVAWHHVIVTAFLLAVPLLMSGAGRTALVPVAMLAMTYPLYHVFNKYAVPATPFLLLGAAQLVDRLLEARRAALRVMALGLAALLATLVTPASLVLAGCPVGLARTIVPGVLCAALGGVFVWTWRHGARDIATRMVALAAALAFAAAQIGGLWDDPSWRAFDVALSRPVRQDLQLAPGDLALVNGAREAYLALDLELPDGDPSDVSLELANGPRVNGSELVPTMPAFGLATHRGGRDPRAFRQWWIARWRPEMAPGGSLSVTVRGDATSRLAGDVGPDPPRTHHGLSLGHWPHVSVYRLMHEGEYRLPVHQPLDGGTRRAWTAGGAPLNGTYGIRVLALDDEAGGARWETAAARPGMVVTAVWARAGRSEPAVLSVGGEPVAFELGGSGPWRSGGLELRHVPTGEYEGWYLLHAPVGEAGPLTLEVRPTQRMSSARKYFLPALRPEAPPIPADWNGVPYVEPVRILSARETPAWRPVAVY